MSRSTSRSRSTTTLPVSDDEVVDISNRASLDGEDVGRSDDDDDDDEPVELSPEEQLGILNFRSSLL